jgi:ferredoxin
MTRPARLVVDPIACDGRGLCAELLPGLITLDDWGFPVMPDGDIPASLHADAATVVRLCPRLALRLERAAPARTDRGRTTSAASGPCLRMRDVRPAG